MQEEKVVVYSGSKNLYPRMVTACKSLVANSQVDRVIMLVEDDKFPYALPSFVELKNVSKQGYFAKDGANWNTSYTYMSLMRVTYSKLFPDISKVLQLDVDTIVLDDLAPLWDLDLSGYYFAAVEEKTGSWGMDEFGSDKYYNIGVAMFNLDLIREDGIDDDLIRMLNKKKLSYIDQDAWHLLGASKALSLSARYNDSFVTAFTDDPAVVHYAASKKWWEDPRMPRREYLRKYQNMPWGDVLELRRKLYEENMEKPLNGME